MRSACLCMALLLCACGHPPRKEAARFVPPAESTAGQPSPWRPVPAPAAEVFPWAASLLAAQGLTLVHSDDEIGLLKAQTPGGRPFTVLVQETSTGSTLTVSSADGGAVAAFWQGWEQRVQGTQKPPP